MSAYPFKKSKPSEDRSRPSSRWLGFVITKAFTRCPATKACSPSRDPRFDEKGNPK